MATPYKMKGHTLPGIKQKKSPMKEPLSALAVGLITAGATSALSAGTSAIAAKRAKKKEAKALAKANEQDAKTTGIESMGKKMGSSTKLV